MTAPGPSSNLLTAIQAYADSTELLTGYGQFCAARCVAAFSPKGGIEQYGDRLAPAARASYFEAHGFLAQVDMRLTDAATYTRAAARAWREADDRPRELSALIAHLGSRMASDGVRPETPDLIAALERVLTVLRSAQPTRRRLVDAITTVGFAQLSADRLNAAKEYFVEADELAGDATERARTLSARALAADQSGDVEAGMKLARDAMTLARHSGDRLQLATILRFVVGARGTDTRTIRPALRMAHEAVELSEEFGGVMLASNLRLRGLLCLALYQLVEVAGEPPEPHDDANDLDLDSALMDLDRSIMLVHESEWQCTLVSEILAYIEILRDVGRLEEGLELLHGFEAELDAADGDERIGAEILRAVVATEGRDLDLLVRYSESAADRMAAVHHTATSEMYRVAQKAYEYVADRDGVRRCATKLTALTQRP